MMSNLTIHPIVQCCYYFLLYLILLSADLPLKAVLAYLYLYPMAICWLVLSMLTLTSLPGGLMRILIKKIGIQYSALAVSIAAGLTAVNSLGLWSITIPDPFNQFTLLHLAFAVPVILGFAFANITNLFEGLSGRYKAKDTVAMMILLLTIDLAYVLSANPSTAAQNYQLTITISCLCILGLSLLLWLLHSTHSK